MKPLLINGDARRIPLADDSVDLVFGSPPYEAARTYGIGFKLKGQDWVDWMVEVFMESLRVCKGLVAFVLEGQTKDYRWSATPALLMADLHRRGVHLRKPPIYQRVGIPGSGGPDWFRNDWEFIVCATRGGKLPWSDNTACGHAPKWAPGGEMAHRLSDGSRVNQWGRNGGSTERHVDGKLKRAVRPSHKTVTKKMYSRNQDGKRDEGEAYAPPAIANPGNIIKCKVGGGLMGSPLAHENEAPFPEKLSDFFVLSCCQSGGLVLDPFSGSGTTGASATKYGRRFVGIDRRMSQVELSARRINGTQLEMF